LPKLPFRALRGLRSPSEKTILKGSKKPREIIFTEHFQLSQRQLREIEDIVKENRDYLFEKWREIQGGEE